MKMIFLISNIDVYQQKTSVEIVFLKGGNFIKSCHITFNIMIHDFLGLNDTCFRKQHQTRLCIARL